MKKTLSCFLILVAFLFMSGKCDAQFETLDKLMRSLAYTDDRAIRKAAFNYIVNNPELAKTVLFFPNPESFQNAAKYNAFVGLKVSSYKGLISPEEFFDISFRLIANIDSYHPATEKDKALKWYSTGVANYKWFEKEGSAQDLFGLFEIVLKNLSAMKNNNLISNAGLENSLTVKINSAKEAIQKHQLKGINQAINKIDAAVSEANAQRGKKIDENACKIFLVNCKNLIWQIGHTNF